MKAAVAVHVLLTGLFLAMAVLQLNDPDPLLWAVVYAGVAVMPAAKALGLRLPVAFGMAVGMAIACLLMSLPGFIDFLGSGDLAAIGGEMSTARPYVESAREFLGVTAGAVCLGCYWNWHGRPPRR